MNLSSPSLFVCSLFNTALPLDYTPSIVMHNDAHGARRLTPFPAFPPPSTLCSTVAHPLVYTLMNRFWMDLLFSPSLSLSSSSSVRNHLSPHFFTCLLTLYSPHNTPPRPRPALATNVTASVDICSGALLFFICLHATIIHNGTPCA